MLLHTHQIQFTVSLLLSFVDADCRLAHSTYISTDAPIPLPPPPPKKKKHTFNCWLPSYLCWIYFAWSVPCLLVCLLVVYFVVYLVLNSLCLTHLYCKNFPVVCFRCGAVRFTYIQTQTSKKKARVYLLSSGFSLAFGSMFAKTYRVHRIFTRSGSSVCKDKMLQDAQLISLVCALLLLDGLVLTLWVVFDPMERHLSNLTLEISLTDRSVVYQPQVNKKKTNWNKIK